MNFFESLKAVVVTVVIGAQSLLVSVGILPQTPDAQVVQLQETVVQYADLLGSSTPETDGGSPEPAPVPEEPEAPAPTPEPVYEAPEPVVPPVIIKVVPPSPEPEEEEEGSNNTNQDDNTSMDTYHITKPAGSPLDVPETMTLEEMRSFVIGLKGQTIGFIKRMEAGDEATVLEWFTSNGFTVTKQ